VEPVNTGHTALSNSTFHNNNNKQHLNEHAAQTHYTIHQGTSLTHGITIDCIYILLSVNVTRPSFGDIAGHT